MTADKTMLVFNCFQYQEDIDNLGTLLLSMSGQVILRVNIINENSDKIFKLTTGEKEYETDITTVTDIQSPYNCYCVWLKYIFK